MASGDPGPSSEARVQEARLAALREEMTRRTIARPEEKRDGRRGKVATIRGGMLLLVLALILGGLYVLRVSSRELRMRDDSGARRRF